MPPMFQNNQYWIGGRRRVAQILMDQRYRKSCLHPITLSIQSLKNPIQEKVFVLCGGWVRGKESHTNIFKLQLEKNQTKVSHNILLMKRSADHFISLPVFYLITGVMTASKNSWKIAILKIWELISLRDIKTHFGDTLITSKWISVLWKTFM